MRLLGAGYKTVHGMDFSIQRPQGYGDYLLLIMRTESFHVIGQKRHILPSDTVILYGETTFQYYGATQDIYVDDWVHFRASKDEIGELRQLGIKLDVPLRIADVEQLSSIIRNITVELYSANPNRDSTSEIYLKLLFNKLGDRMYFGIRKGGGISLYEKLNLLRADIYNMPQLDWNVTDMARQLSISVSYFQHIYKRAFGISVMNDVIISRIEQGKILLAGTDLPVRTVAERCGYEYDIYFMRQFKSKVGMTALQYRKQAGKVNSILH